MHLGFDVISRPKECRKTAGGKARRHLVAPNIIAAMILRNGENERQCDVICGQKRELGPPHSLARKR
jgi:hypothetical protein